MHDLLYDLPLGEPLLTRALPPEGMVALMGERGDAPVTGAVTTPIAMLDPAPFPEDMSDRALVEGLEYAAAAALVVLAGCATEPSVVMLANMAG